MKRLFLFLLAWQLSFPAPAGAATPFGGAFSGLRNLDRYMDSSDEFMDFEEDYAGEIDEDDEDYYADDDEEDFEDYPAEDREEPGTAEPYPEDDFGAIKIQSVEDLDAQFAAYCPDVTHSFVMQVKAKKGKGSPKGKGKSKGGKKGKTGRSCGGCQSGCGMIKAGLRPAIKKFVEEAEKIGIHPVSCIRTQACQDRLRSCYEKCGNRGRAAKKSKHADGRACDFSKSDGGRLTKLKQKTGLPIKRLTHGKEGGGLHEYE